MGPLGFLGNEARASARLDLAEKIWRLPYSRLLRYGISSYREITDLDVIGIPVWVCYRPLASTISVTCGKNPDRLLAGVGSIVEAIEFWAAEHPGSTFRVCTHQQLAQEAQQTGQPQVLAFEAYPLARDHITTSNTPLPWEVVDSITKLETLWMPSHMVWLHDRVQMQFLDVQQTSNGLASGTSLEDALLQAFYELVERDGWTINQFVRELLGTPPVKVPLVDLPPELEWTVNLIRKAGLYPFVFNCTTDLNIPVIGCALCGRDGVGLFGGYGAHLDPRVAAQRALIESVQSRLTYISGARDDLYRRDFILMKRHGSDRMIMDLEAMEPVARSWPEFASRFLALPFSDVREELIALKTQLGLGGIDQLYYRVLGREEFGEYQLVIVKAVAPQLEGCWCDSWQSNGRATAQLAKEVSHVRAQ